jgi:Predicted nucleoside-diphosphate sugar epimerases
MGTTIIFGAGGLGKTLFPQVEAAFSTGPIVFCDSNPALWGTSLFDKPIICPNEIREMTYDRIIVASITGYETITDQLINVLGVSRDKIDTSFIRDKYEKTTCVRNRFLKRFAEIVYAKKIQGNVAEGGVFEGYFARQINAEFPDRTLYLFDTFKGFDERDISVEKGDTRNRANHYNANVTEADLLATMSHPERVVIRKGYFPETALDIDDRFVFVNLDFDLYNPTLAGLEYFYPRMVSGGVILVHDYFQDSVILDESLLFQGIRQAVGEFCDKHDVMIMPIGDEMSIAILKM